MRIRANIWHLIGRLNQPAADGFLPLRAFKPSPIESADRGRSIIQVKVKAKGIYGIRLKISKVCFIFTNKARNPMYISRINIMKVCCIIHFEWYLLWFFKNCDQQNLLPRSREKWLVKSIFREPQWEPILPFIFLSRLLILIRFQIFFFLLLLEFRLQFIFLFIQLLFRINLVEIRIPKKFSVCSSS